MYPTNFTNTPVADPREGSSGSSSTVVPPGNYSGRAVIPLDPSLEENRACTQLFENNHSVPAENEAQKKKSPKTVHPKLFTETKKPCSKKDIKEIERQHCQNLETIKKNGKDEDIAAYIKKVPKWQHFGLVKRWFRVHQCKIYPDFTVRDSNWRKDRRELSQYIPYILHFKLTRKECLELAQFLSAKPQSRIAEHIALFKFTPEELKIVAKTLVRAPKSDFAKYVKHFGLTDLTRFAYLCAQTPNSGFAEHVDNFGSIDPKSLLKIAKLCAKTPDSQLAKHINNFHIADPKKIYRLLELAAATKNSGVAACIQAFPFLSDKQRFKLAILCAKTEGSEIEKYIKNFSLLDKERLTVAKIRAQTENSHLASNIKNFGIIDPQELFDIACLDAQTEGSEIEEFIQDFGFTDPRELFAIARLCSKREDTKIVKHIEKFNLSQMQRFTIVELLVRTHPKSKKLNKTIDRFDLSEPQRFKIAEFFISSFKCKQLIRYIQKFNLSEEHRLQIAKLCAIKRPDALLEYSHHMKNFDLSEKDREELLLDCIEINPKLTLENLTGFNLNPEKTREAFFSLAKKIGIEAYQKNYDRILTQYNVTYSFDEDGFHRVKQSPSLYELFKMVDEKKWDSKEAKKILKDFIGEEFFCAGALVHLVDEIQDLSPPKASTEETLHLRMELHCWLAATLFILKSHDMSKEELAFILEQNLLEHLKDFHSPFLRNALSHLLPFVVKTEEDRGFIQQQEKNLLYPWEQKYARTRILRIVLANLRKDVSEETLEQFLSQIKKSKRNGKNLFVEAGRFRTLVQALFLLSDSRLLNSSEKESLLIRLTQEATVKGRLDTEMLMKNLYALITLIEIGETKQLKESPFTLIQLSEEAFTRDLPLGKIDSFAEAYLKTFGSTPRKSWAIRTYTAKMKAHKEPKLMEALGLYVTSVLDGTWPAIRYDETRNPHLKAVFSQFPNLREKWLTNKSYVLTDLLSGQSFKQELVDMEEFLNENLITFSHLNLSSLPKLSIYLTTQEEGEKQRLRKTILSRQISEKDDFYFAALLEQQCIRLIQESDINGQIQCLGHIQQTLSSHSTFCNSQFSHDVKGMIEQLKKIDQHLILSSYRVVETDDPFRLLLCGTDVDSCQRVDSPGANNRGLEGYLLHGQTKLDAILDPKDERTVSRSMSRLLLDEDGNPVLFMEKIYNGIKPEFKEALLELNRRRAKELGIPLLTQYKKLATGPLYGKNLKSLGGLAPYEYVDSADGLEKNGEYQIENAYYLDPQPLEKERDELDD